MKKIDKFDVLWGLLVAVIVVSSLLFMIGKLPTSHINCANYQCTAVTKILFINSTPLKTFNQVDVDEVVVVTDEFGEDRTWREPETHYITVTFQDAGHQRIATSTDEAQILSAAEELRSYLEEPDEAELSIALGPTGYDKFGFFLALFTFGFVIACFSIMHVFGPF